MYKTHGPQTSQELQVGKHCSSDGSCPTNIKNLLGGEQGNVGCTMFHFEKLRLSASLSSNDVQHNSVENKYSYWLTKKKDSFRETVLAHCGDTRRNTLVENNVKTTVSLE